MVLDVRMPDILAERAVSGRMRLELPYREGMTASDVGATAFNALFRLIGEEAVEGDVYQIPTRLIVRNSTGRPRRK